MEMTMTTLNQTCESENKETLGEIFAIISILIKFGFDEIIENKTVLVAFLNELKVKINDAKITQYTLTKLTESVTDAEKAELIEEFRLGHEPIYRKLAMVTNKC